MMTQDKFNQIKALAKGYFLDYSKNNHFGTEYDFSKIPFRIHKLEKHLGYLVVIESPEEDVFYSPASVIFRDKAFIEIVNNEVITQNPYDGSAPMWHDEFNTNVKNSGLFSGSMFFTSELDLIKQSIVNNIIDVDLMPYAHVDTVITHQELLTLFNKKGIFYMINEEVVCILIFKTIELDIGCIDKQYSVRIFYNISTGKIENISAIDITPPPALC